MSGQKETADVLSQTTAVYSRLLFSVQVKRCSFLAHFPGLEALCHFNYKQICPLRHPKAGLSLPNCLYRAASLHFQTI